jgi:hypothetical protein
MLSSLVKIPKQKELTILADYTYIQNQSILKIEIAAITASYSFSFDTFVMYLKVIKINI